MNATQKNIFGAVAGFIVGSVINMGILSVSTAIIPPPTGADVSTMEGLKASMYLFEPRHFLMPFLAHALGTLTGSFICAKIAETHHIKLAMAIGLLFFAGGLANVMMLPSPAAFTVLDLGLAYFPMAYLGWKFARKGNS